MPDITSAKLPKPDTKLALLVQRLGGPGCSIADLVAALGWQRHTVRAAITGLRKRGYDVQRTQAKDSGIAMYRLVTSTRAKRRTK